MVNIPNQPTDATVNQNIDTHKNTTLNQNIDTHKNTDANEVETRKLELIRQYVTTPDILDCLLYAAKGGKNLRTHLALDVLNDTLLEVGLNLSSEVLGWLRDACFSLEMIHIASLILDDCPQMDNSQTRRDRESTHVKFGLAMAQLSSFVLLDVSHQITMNVIQSLYLRQLIKPDVLNYLHFDLEELKSQMLGENGLAGGQIYDLYLLKNHPNPNLDDYLKMITLKTGRLFQACFILPKLFVYSLSDSTCINHQRSKLSEKYRTELEQGVNFGIAFQIRDDLEDHEIDQTTNNILNYCNRDEAIELIRKSELAYQTY